MPSPKLHLNKAKESDFALNLKILNEKIYSIYLFANALWILVIQANFSNRFAYLSWFMLGLVIVYPFLKQLFFKNQSAILGNILLLYFVFTYLFDFVLG